MGLESLDHGLTRRSFIQRGTAAAWTARRVIGDWDKIIVANVLQRFSSPAEQGETVSDLSELIFFTDDFAGKGEGCDSITIATIKDGVIYRAPIQNVSPGRLDVSDNVTTVVTAPTNSTNSLYVLKLNEAQWAASFPTPEKGQHFLYGSAIKLVGDNDLFVGTRDDDGQPWVQNPHHLQNYLSFCSQPNEQGNTPDELIKHDKIAIDGVPFEIINSYDPDVYFVARTQRFDNGQYGSDYRQGGHIWVDKIRVDPESKKITVLTTVPGVDIDTNFKYEVAQPERFARATGTVDDLIIINGGNQPFLQVVDINATTTQVIDLKKYGITQTLGVAYNFADVNSGLVAIHCGEEIVIGKIKKEAFDIISRVPVVAAKLSYLGLNGAVAWDATGRHIVVAVDGVKMDRTDPAVDFVAYSVAEDGIIDSTAPVQFIACTSTVNAPNDIYTINRKRPRKPAEIPSPVPTATEIVEPTPTSKPTPKTRRQLLFPLTLKGR